jgi:two-component SAPR family response regulator
MAEVRWVEAWTCENPGEAISMLRSTDYDILITEIIFTGAEGFPFVDWVLANCPGIFIVVVTNAPFSWISRLGFMRHVQFCLERPLKRDALEKALRGLKTWNHD